MYSHLVMFTLEDPDDVAATAQMLQGMQAHIPQIRFLEVGIDDSPSERSAHLVLITRFDSREAMEAYRTHPHHQQIVQHLRELGARGIKVDYAE